MNFAWPAAWGFLLFAIPITLFYLIQQRLRSKSISTLLFWQEAPPQARNAPLWKQLRGRASLLLQFLFLLLLALALTQPHRKVQATAARSLIILLDPSSTMAVLEKEGSRWKQAKLLATDLISSLGFLREAILIQAGTQPRVLQPWTSNRQELTQALEGATFQKSQESCENALQLAVDLAKNRPKSQIVLITDAVWERAPANLEAVKVLKVGNEQPNAGITLFTARRNGSNPIEAELEIVLERNTEGPQQGELTITQNDTVLDSLVVNLTEQRWARSWKLEGFDNQELKAEFKPTGADAWQMDNRAGTRLAGFQPLRVTLISNAESYVEAALRAVPAVQLKKLPEPDQTIPTDLWVFNQINPPAGFQAEATLLINPPNQGAWGENKGAPVRAFVTEVQEKAPILRHVNLLETKITALNRFLPSNEAVIYAKAGERPVLFGNWEQTPRTLVLAFRPEDSEIVNRTTFPILIHNLAVSSRDLAAPERNSQPGATATSLKSLSLATDETATDASGIALPGWKWWKIALSLGLLWLLVEWFLYTRRMTE